MRLGRPRLLVGALGALGLLLAAFELNTLAPLTGTQGVVFGRPSHLIIDFGAGAICAVAALRHQGRARVAWLMVAAGILAWTGGDVYWTVVLLDEPTIPVPSPADAGYLLFPLLAFAGLAGLLRSCARRTASRLWVDGIAAALATAAVAAAVVVPAVMDYVGGDAASVATNLAYPLSDLILLGLVVGAAAITGWRMQPAWILAGAGVVAFWIADSHYLLAVADDAYVFPDAFDAGWSVAFLLLAGGALAPAPVAAAVESTSRRFAILPLVFGGAGVGVLVYGGLHETTPIAITLAALALGAVGVRLWIAFRDNVAMLRHSRREALTDALTGLGNRRALTRELEALLPGVDPRDPRVLVLLDLDGFKHYNDSYGHPAGDDVLVRLGARLQRTVGDDGRAYRMGGDEFCALLRTEGREPADVAATAAAALSERGEGFDIRCSHGLVVLPVESRDPAEAIRLADQRMYAHKDGSGRSAGSQSRDVLLRALAERNPELGEHLSTVAELAVAVAERLGLGRDAVVQVRHAADLHDVGKVAIPDAILHKAGPLDADEWAFMHRHTIIGERIVAAAPALQEVARIVRASHERHDGRGYPDGLRGDAIPLGARIVAVCDSFDAMVADRPYRKAMSHEAALAELERCAGSQFDPVVVEAFQAAHAELARRGALPRAA